MSWPLASHFSAMLQNPRLAFRDPVLRKCRIAKDNRNQPQPWAGAFAVVYKGISIAERPFAVRVFTTESPERREHYHEISAYLKTRNLSCLVNFEYRDDSIRSAGDGKWYPLVLMDWVEGQTLFRWARARALEGNRGAMAGLARRWLELVKEMDDARIAHGNLEHGNVMVTDQGGLKLVDYDCMCVPSLVGRRNPEVGIEPYQHPERDTRTRLSLEMDRFSALVIFIALRALAANPALWAKYVEGPEYDKLLFRKEDFERPKASPLVKDLLALPDALLRNLVKRLFALAHAPMSTVPPLSELANSYTNIESIRRDQQRGQSHDASSPGLAPPTGQPTGAWPTSTNYVEAVQNLRQSIGDQELRAGQVAANPLGLPMLWSGNFADVYKIHNASTGNTWALKCFTRRVAGQAERYHHISTHLDRAQLPFMIDFTYLDRGVCVRGTWYPALKMRWIEGIRLNEFVEQHLNRPRTLKGLLQLWVKMAKRLREAKMAHGDLQHGNVLLVPHGEKSLALRLIDYDGMYVPAFAGTRSTELGHPAFQHPQRSREGIFTVDLDRFSHLAIYTAIHCLMVGGEKLWKRFNNDENLLFREDDYRHPDDSEAFRTLWKLPDSESRGLVGRLVLASRMPLDKTPLLDEITNGPVSPLTRTELHEVESILGRRATPVPTAVANPSDYDRHMVEQHGLPNIRLADVTLPRSLVELMPESVARQNTVLPLAEQDGALLVAISDPNDVELIEKLRFIFNRPINCAFAPRDSIIQAIDRHYGPTVEESADSILQEFIDTALDFTEPDDRENWWQRGP